MYCKNCGHQVNDNAKFCKNCGANITPKIVQMETAIVEQPTQVSNVPTPVYGNPVNVGTNDIPPSFKSSRDTLKRWVLAAGVLVVLMIIGVIATIFSSDETKFLSLSEQEQEILMEDLYERLDQHFVSDLQIEQQLAQLLVYEDETMYYFYYDMDKEELEQEGKEIGLKVGKETMEIAEKWATDNNIDFEDFINSTSDDDENLVTYYLSHLIELATAEAETLKREILKSVVLKNESYYSTTQAYFYNEPNENSRKNAYLAEGDVTLITNIQNDFGYTVFTNKIGQITTGWLRMDEMKLNNMLGNWTILPENDEMGYGIPTLHLYEDGTAGYNMSDDWYVAGRYSFNGNTLYFKGKPEGENAEGDETEMEESFTLKGNLLFSSSSSWVVLIEEKELNAIRERMDREAQLKVSQISTSIDGVVINDIRWATRNVDHPGSFAANPENPGMFYQLNSRKGWDATSENVTGWDNSSTSNNETGWESVNDPCPSGWRIPTKEELQSLTNSGSGWTSRNGVSGRLFGITTPNQIFLPAAGWRNNYLNGRLNRTETHGVYWSNMLDPNSNTWDLLIYSDDARIDVSRSENGYSIRCVKE